MLLPIIKQLLKTLDFALSKLGRNWTPMRSGMTGSDIFLKHLCDYSFFFFLRLHPQHMNVAVPGIEPVPRQ